MRNRSKRGQKEISKAVAFEARALGEAVLKEPREQSFVFAERDNAIANVARRQHVEFLTQATAGAAIVADRHYGAKITNNRRSSGRFTDLRRGEGEALESFQQSRKARATADRDHAQTALARRFLFFQKQEFCSAGLHGESQVRLTT